MALKAFATSGYDGSSLRSIAAEAGVDPALISRRYGSKMGLWRAVVDGLAENLDMVHAEIQTGLKPGEPLSARVIAGMRRFITLNWAVPELALIFIDEIATPGERRDYIVTRIWRPYFHAIRPILTEASALTGGEGKNANFTALSVLGIIVMPQLLASLLEADIGISYEEAPEAVLDVLLRLLT
ncbi:TetR/AcrR family transcriptional regulator [Novosphingobium sp. BL-8A]|uniref:TetR/AcrR family transcriptional regulator n=1 Tax=Novosphingobium sp. BL-8A TaxID=3127639 RepID=UPI0037578C2E